LGTDKIDQSPVLALAVAERTNGTRFSRAAKGDVGWNRLLARHLVRES